ncbi:MAG: hypothetical protein ABI655_15870 [Phenylobacterium sp.]
MTLAIDTTFPILERARILGSIRYAGVLAVWGGLFLIRPQLALSIFRERRPDSPLRRRTRGSDDVSGAPPARRVL